jgi:hypothetical protein
MVKVQVMIEVLLQTRQQILLKHKQIQFRVTGDAVLFALSKSGASRLSSQQGQNDGGWRLCDSRDGKGEDKGEAGVTVTQVCEYNVYYVQGKRIKRGEGTARLYNNRSRNPKLSLNLGKQNICKKTNYAIERRSRPSMLCSSALGEDDL